MLNIVCLVCLLSFPLLAVGQSPAPGVSCQITADKQVYKAGEEPLITIRLLNKTDSTVQLVKVLDGSESRMRFPYLYYEVYQLANSTSKRVARPRVVRCGNMDGIGVEDFVAVKPGEAFNPLANQTIVYTSGVSLAGWIRTKGRYKIILHYSTNQSDFKQWMGDMAMDWFDWKTGEVTPDKREAYAKLATLFAKVPKGDVASNDLVIDFQ